jgi:peptidoglycan hydrolase-like protein with peptidoglycan-binding domain
MGTHRVQISWNEGNAPGAFITVDGFDVLGTVPSSPTMTTVEILWAEQRLADLSYRPGPIDGVFDKKTRAAVIAFQKWEGLTRDGTLNSNVWSRLQTATRPKPKYSGTNTWIEVNKAKQVLLFVQKGALKWTLPVSTGTTGDGGIITPSGSFKVLRKTLETNPRYLPLYIRSTGYLAIHGYPSVPTYPASHGCVRTQTWDQDQLYPLVPLNTPVYIY